MSLPRSEFRDRRNRVQFHLIGFFHSSSRGKASGLPRRNPMKRWNMRILLRWWWWFPRYIESLCFCRKRRAWSGSRKSTRLKVTPSLNRLSNCSLNTILHLVLHGLNAMLKSIHNLFLVMLCSCLLHTFVFLVGLARLERSRQSL